MNSKPIVTIEWMDGDTNGPSDHPRRAGWWWTVECNGEVSAAWAPTFEAAIFSVIVAYREHDTVTGVAA
jgi:hypothetical protein